MMLDYIGEYQNEDDLVRAVHTCFISFLSYSAVSLPEVFWHFYNSHQPRTSIPLKPVAV